MWVTCVTTPRPLGENRYPCRFGKKQYRAPGELLPHRSERQASRHGRVDAAPGARRELAAGSAARSEGGGAEGADVAVGRRGGGGAGAAAISADVDDRAELAKAAPNHARELIALPGGSQAGGKKEDRADNGKSTRLNSSPSQ